MSRSDIVALVTSAPEYKQACRRVARDNPLYEDLYHEALIILFTQDEARLKEIHEGGYLRPWFVRLILTLWHKPHSSFYKSHRAALSAPPLPPEYDYETDLNILNVKSKLTEMKSNTRRGYFQAETLSAYLREGSAGKLEIKTGIPKRTIAHTVKKAKLELREMCSFAK